MAAWPLLLSARSEAALKGQAERLRAHVLAHPELALADLAYSLATTRTVFQLSPWVIAAAISLAGPAACGGETDGERDTERDAAAGDREDDGQADPDPVEADLVCTCASDADCPPDHVCRFFPGRPGCG